MVKAWSETGPWSPAEIQTSYTDISSYRYAAPDCAAVQHHSAWIIKCCRCANGLSIKDYTCFYSLEDMNSLIQPPEDELLVYKWEGFGRPYSITGSLSSLESFGKFLFFQNFKKYIYFIQNFFLGHVDDLDLSSTLQFLEGQAVLPLNTTSTSITTSTLSEVDSEDLSSSAQADYYSIPHQTFTDSWV